MGTPPSCPHTATQVPVSREALAPRPFLPHEADQKTPGFTTRLSTDASLPQVSSRGMRVTYSPSLLKNGKSSCSQQETQLCS